MKHLFYISLLSLSFSAMGQIIEVPSGSALTVQGDLNLPTGFSIQYSGQKFIKAPTPGSFNTYLGLEAGNTGTGTQNTFLGYQTGRTNTSGNNNAAVGFQAGYGNTSGQANVFIGYQAGYTNTTAAGNVFIGSQAGYKNSTGTGNMFLGQQAGYNSTGNYNLFMGNASGSSTTSGSGNTAIGDGSLLNNTVGIRNTAIGQYAGVSNIGSNNVFIGYNANPTSASLTNAVAIGSNAQVSQSNSIVLGNGANVGIGTSAPSAKLELLSGSTGVSGLKLSSLGTTATVLNQTKFLTVDGSGNVILGSLNGSAREAATEVLWQRRGSFLESARGEAIIIGQGISKTPADYNLFVSKGILTEKVKVAVKSSVDWSDKVFEKGYRLRSLDEVEQQIQATGHLPGVPSAAEVVEQGIDLGKMDAKLLEKIEELTLHMIAIKKQVTALEQENKSLREALQEISSQKRP